MDFAYAALDRGYIPDFLLRRAINALNRQRLSTLSTGTFSGDVEKKKEYIESLKRSEIAIETDKANEQHYEVETDFMMGCLGKRAKYSCCLYTTGKETLDEAEELMLKSYCIKAKLKDGQDILDLGCGWGSLCLFLAERYPNSKIRALSNSKTQKIHIDGVAKRKGFKNLEVFTGDVKVYEFQEGTFDRILSIEMFEHMKNYSHLFKKVSRWLKPLSSAPSPENPSLLFIHIFCHRYMPYHFEQDDGWMAKNFFSGGTMPSYDLFLHFQQDVVLEQSWWLNGTHYGQTCEDWLKLQDASNVSGAAVARLRADAQAKGLDPMEGEKTFYRFRVFYLACAVFFATDKGEQWGVGHYLFSRRN